MGGKRWWFCNSMMISLIGFQASHFLCYLWWLYNIRFSDWTRRVPIWRKRAYFVFFVITKLMKWEKLSLHWNFKELSVQKYCESGRHLSNYSASLYVHIYSSLIPKKIILFMFLCMHVSACICQRYQASLYFGGNCIPGYGRR